MNFSLEEYQRRVSKVQKSMMDRGLDFLIASDPSNMAWLTGYDGWSFYVHQAVLVPVQGAPIWWGRRMDGFGANLTCFMGAEGVLAYPDRYVQNPEEHPMEHLAVCLKERGLDKGRIGVEKDNYYFSAKACETLIDHLPNASLIDATALVNWQRAVKSQTEIEYMKIAGKIVERMHQTIVELVEPGLPKNKLVSEIYRVAIDGADSHGGDYPAIVPLIPSGREAAAAHLTWDERPFEADSLSFFEIAGCHKRYHAPLCRSVYLGKAPQYILDAEKALIDGIQAGLEQAKPGNRCSDIAKAFESVMQSADIDRANTRCGYPIGLSYPPDWGERTMSIRVTDDSILQPNMTFHFMPGLWMEDWGLELTESIRITDTGVELLCNYPRKLVCK